jgi:SPP1 family predicted phage head-tail adaptor
VYKLNRRITIRRYSTVKNDFGGLVSVQTGSWSKWAQVNERFGTSSSTLQQQVWEYDQRFIIRFEKDRPTKSNDLIEYEEKNYSALIDRFMNKENIKELWNDFVYNEFNNSYGD